MKIVLDGKCLCRIHCYPSNMAAWAWLIWQNILLQNFIGIVRLKRIIHVTNSCSRPQLHCKVYKKTK